MSRVWSLDTNTFTVTCMACGVIFGSAGSLVPIACPLCAEVQPFPIVVVDGSTRRCLICGARIGAPLQEKAVMCPNAHKEIENV
jgi:DNA-directed RNA polymerase subunit RPC12/RpoP